MEHTQLTPFVQGEIKSVYSKARYLFFCMNDGANEGNVPYLPIELCILIFGYLNIFVDELFSRTYLCDMVATNKPIMWDTLSMRATELAIIQSFFGINPYRMTHHLGLTENPERTKCTYSTEFLNAAPYSRVKAYLEKVYCSYKLMSAHESHSLLTRYDGVTLFCDYFKSHNYSDNDNVLPMTTINNILIKTGRYDTIAKIYKKLYRIVDYNSNIPARLTYEELDKLFNTIFGTTDNCDYVYFKLCREISALSSQDKYYSAEETKVYKDYLFRELHYVENGDRLNEIMYSFPADLDRKEWFKQYSQVMEHKRNYGSTVNDNRIPCFWSEFQENTQSARDILPSHPEYNGWLIDYVETGGILNSISHSYICSIEKVNPELYKAIKDSGNHANSFLYSL